MAPETIPADKTAKVVDFVERRRSAGLPVGAPVEDVGRPARARHRARQTVLFVLTVAIAALVGTAVWRMARAPVAHGILEASGRIEGRITTVSPKSLGRVVKILVDEGQAVGKDQVLALLDDDAQRQRIRGAEENRHALEERLRSADTQLAVTTEQVPLQIAQARDALTQAEGSLAEARANAEQTERDAGRDAQLFGRGLIAAQQTELSALRARLAREALREAEANVARAEKGLSLAELGRQQLEAQRQERDSLSRQVRQAEAALAEQESYAADFVIRSPLSGTVLTRNIELGEHVNVGDTLYTLVDLNQLYLKVYVPEPEIGRVALGQEARVYVDAHPGRPFAARVNRIYQEAEFTPKNVETKEERVKLVFPVELLLTENPGGRLKPGMPADGVIRVEADAPWPAMAGGGRLGRGLPALPRPGSWRSPAPTR